MKPLEKIMKRNQREARLKGRFRQELAQRQQAAEQHGKNLAQRRKGAEEAARG